jgi:hypothetical protein
VRRSQSRLLCPGSLVFLSYFLILHADKSGLVGQQYWNQQSRKYFASRRDFRHVSMSFAWLVRWSSENNFPFRIDSLTRYRRRERFALLSVSDSEETSRQQNRYTSATLELHCDHWAAAVMEGGLGKAKRLFPISCLKARCLA